MTLMRWNGALDVNRETTVDRKCDRYRTVTPGNGDLWSYGKWRPLTRSSCWDLRIPHLQLDDDKDLAVRLGNHQLSTRSWDCWKAPNKPGSEPNRAASVKGKHTVESRSWQRINNDSKELSARSCTGMDKDALSWWLVNASVHGLRGCGTYEAYFLTPDILKIQTVQEV